MTVQTYRYILTKDKSFTIVQKFTKAIQQTALNYLMRIRILTTESVSLLVCCKCSCLWTIRWPFIVFLSNQLALSPRLRSVHTKLDWLIFVLITTSVVLNDNMTFFQCLSFIEITILRKMVI